jgi:hypothetical protein
MARTGFRDAARELGLVGIQPAEGESMEDAIGRTVLELMRGILLGERQVIPLGAVSSTLRQAYEVEVNDAGVERVVTQVSAARTNMPPTMPPGFPPQGMPEPGAAPAEPAPTPPPGG